MAAQFDRLDTNKDGFRVARGIDRRAWQFRPPALALDVNATGFVSREEAKGSPQLSQNFDAVDGNKDGSLSRDEIHAYRWRTRRRIRAS